MTIFQATMMAGNQSIVRCYIKVRFVWSVKLQHITTKTFIISLYYGPVMFSFLAKCSFLYFLSTTVEAVEQVKRGEHSYRIFLMVDIAEVLHDDLASILRWQCPLRRLNSLKACRLGKSTDTKR